MEDCIFCKIARKELPSTIYFEDDFVIAIKPLHEAIAGHTLIIPKKHSENIFDIDAVDLERSIIVVKNLAIQSLDDGASGVNMINNSGVSAGQSVSHFHLHLLPRRNSDNLEIGKNL